MFARFVPKIPQACQAVMQGHQCRIMRNWYEFGISQLPKIVPWGAPAVLLVGWMAFPALTENFKASIGLAEAKPSAGSSTYQWEDVGLDLPPKLV